VARAVCPAEAVEGAGGLRLLVFNPPSIEPLWLAWYIDELAMCFWFLVSRTMKDSPRSELNAKVLRSNSAEVMALFLPLLGFAKPAKDE